MDNVPYKVLSFFCLSMLYLITFIRSSWICCSFSKFIHEAKIAKVFYCSIIILCLVRSMCFGIITTVFTAELDKMEQMAKHQHSLASIANST